MNLSILAAYWRLKEEQIDGCLEITSKTHGISKKRVYDIVLKSTVSLEVIPDELYFEMIENLPIKDILRLCSTSHRFNQFCKDERVWSFLLRRDFGVEHVKGEEGLKKKYILFYKRFKLRGKISCNFHNTGAITDKGLYMWGDNSSGKLGDGGRTKRLKPVYIDIPGKPLQISCGTGHTGAITDEGLFMWGWNSFGQLGNGKHAIRLTPTKVKSKILGKPLQVSCGGDFTGAITDKGLFTWGLNSSGELGDGTDKDKSKPTPIDIPGKPKLLQISCGEAHAGVITDEGLFMWGANKYGQLGDGTYKNISKPTYIKVPGKPLQVSCGLHHTGVITDKGLFMWGRNYNKQLGVGRETEINIQKPTKVEVPGEPKLLQISCGTFHTGVITTEGLYMWGLNKHGQLGDGTNKDRSKPTKITDKKLGKPLQLSCGLYHTGVITNKGLFMWGENKFGELGLGATYQGSERGTKRKTPTYVDVPGKFA